MCGSNTPPRPARGHCAGRWHLQVELREVLGALVSEPVVCERVAVVDGSRYLGDLNDTFGNPFLDLELPALKVLQTAASISSGYPFRGATIYPDLYTRLNSEIYKHISSTYTLH